MLLRARGQDWEAGYQDPPHNAPKTEPLWSSSLAIAGELIKDILDLSRAFVCWGLN